MAAVRLAAQRNATGGRSRVVALAPGTVGGLDLPVCGARPVGAGTLRRVRAEIQQAGLVIAHGSTTLPVVAAATLGTGVPFVYRSIGDPSAWITTPARRLRVRAAARRSAAVVALWRASAVAWHEVLGVPAGRVWVIPNGVEADKFTPPTADHRRQVRDGLGLAPGDAVVACIGSLSPEKRVDLAIGATGQMDAVTLLIAGDGPERPALERLAQPLGARVRFLGQVDQVQRVLAAADVLLIPSDTEGQPAVAIEAGLSGLPVVGDPSEVWARWSPMAKPDCWSRPATSGVGIGSRPGPGSPGGDGSGGPAIL